ncbi:hypothetical protein SATG_01462 [Staphylococcus aureus subsp. aureus D139]|nr:hypothetical protein SATG_01462 [Staphylococcus aureus subsp. aureus D139]EFC08923.1 conserved hypothetical protein [Staphylococcus aureus subsp. aureus H19]
MLTSKGKFPLNYKYNSDRKESICNFKSEGAYASFSIEYRVLARRSRYMRQVLQWLKEDVFVSSYADKECDALLKAGSNIIEWVINCYLHMNMSLFKFLLTLSNEKY